MTFEARPRRSVVALVGALAGLFACNSELDRNDLAGRPCPCLAGWMCDESQGSTGICVEQVLHSGSGGDAAIGPPDTGAGAAPNVAGAPSDDAGSGEAGAGSDGGGSSGTNGDCAPAAAPTTSDCPPECDDCAGGTCRISCDDARDCSGMRIDCPPGLHCEVSCSSPENCSSTEVQCSGAQACNVICSGRRTCMGLSLACAEGPCELGCGATALACKDSTLSCGSGACRASCQGTESPLAVGCGASCSPACGC